MKKIMTVLASLALVMVSGLFVACEPEHTCVYDVANKDATNHWMECACGAIDETTVVAHEGSFSYNKDFHWTECECGHYDIATLALHTPASEELAYGEETHWLPCECGGKYNEVAHDFKTFVEADAETHTYACECGATKASAHVDEICEIKNGKNNWSDENRNFICDLCGADAPIAGTDLSTKLAANQVEFKFPYTGIPEDYLWGVNDYSFDLYEIDSVGTYYLRDVRGAQEGSPAQVHFIDFKNMPAGNYKITIEFTSDGKSLCLTAAQQGIVKLSTNYQVNYNPGDSDDYDDDPPYEWVTKNLLGDWWLYQYSAGAGFTANSKLSLDSITYTNDAAQDVRFALELEKNVAMDVVITIEKVEA